jgi:hypothetical protein
LDRDRPHRRGPTGSPLSLSSSAKRLEQRTVARDKEGVDVEAPALFAGRQTLFHASTSLYLTAGAGVEVIFGGFNLRLEAGVHGIGAPRDGGSAIEVGGESIVVGYAVVGLGLQY